MSNTNVINIRVRNRDHYRVLGPVDREPNILIEIGFSGCLARKLRLYPV